MIAPVATPDSQSLSGQCKTPLGVNKQGTYTKRPRPTRASSDPAASLDAQIALLNRDPQKPLPATGGTVHIGIDSEWQANAETGRNDIICYTAYVVGDAGSCSFIYYTRSSALAHRLTLQKFISKILARARKKRVVKEMPGRIILCAHFLRADLAHFADFFPEFSRSVDGLRRSVTTLTGDVEMNVDEEKPDRRYRGGRIYVKDATRKTYAVAVRFVDTMMLTPANMGLKEAGALIGLEKLELPAGHDIRQMKKFFSERPVEAKAYAVRDAEITVRYYLKVAQTATLELGLRSLPPTIGAMAVKVFKKGFRDAGRDLDRVFGIEVEDVVYWDERKKAPVRIKRTVTSAARRVFEQFAIDCYHGGRNEAFCVGPTS